MVIDVAGLVPGSVDPRHFELLLDGTSIRGEKVIAALRDHLVSGLSASAAWERNGVNKSQFSRRLDVILSESKRAAELSKFYHKR
ncbi:PapB/FocB family fimbrial expression transcriptional regulator [Pseudomonas fragariae (ex Marin et al. 2024)]|uniref:PapB/FocB family fimbrial expression transcriptional regulator n=1 Tax=Pseudomonas fragariae (ex Marin et al. 2024) TaxID=3080056 RepID=UPI003F7A90A5